MTLSEMEARRDRLLQSNFFIRISTYNPKRYLRILSHVFMTVELLALMTPMVAMGIQWITALCGSTPPMTAMLYLVYQMLECYFSGDVTCANLHNSCIIMPSMRP